MPDSPDVNLPPTDPRPWWADTAAASVPVTPPLDTSSTEAETTTLSAERLGVDTEWVESGRLRLRRRIVSETRTVEVTLRREELIIETHDISATSTGETYLGTALDGPPVPGPSHQAAPLVILLREDVPQVVVRPHVYERVTVHSVWASETVAVTSTARREEARVDTGETPDPVADPPHDRL